MDTKELTEEQKSIAGPLVDAYPELVLMSVKYKGEDRAAVCHTYVAEGEVLLTPLYLVITDDMMADLTNQDGETPQEPKEEANEPQ